MKIQMLFVCFLILSCQDTRVKRLGFACTGWLFFAVLLWVNDRVFCDIWESISFPYLHCAWHILIFIAGYTGCVLGSYFYAASEFPQLRPALSYWPCWSPNLGVPYVILNGVPKEKLLPKDENANVWYSIQVLAWVPSLNLLVISLLKEHQVWG